MRLLSFQVGGDWEALSIIVKLKLTWERNYHGFVTISYYGKRESKNCKSFFPTFLRFNQIFYTEKWENTKQRHIIKFTVDKRREGQRKMQKLQFLILVNRTNTNSIFKTDDCAFIISNYPNMINDYSLL